MGRTSKTKKTKSERAAAVASQPKYDDWAARVAEADALLAAAESELQAGQHTIAVKSFHKARAVFCNFESLRLGDSSGQPLSSDAYFDATDAVVRMRTLCACRRAQCFLESGQWALAIRNASDAFSWDDSNVQAAVLRATALIRKTTRSSTVEQRCRRPTLQDDLELAAEDLEWALQLEPENADAQARVAELEAIFEEMAEAEQARLQAEELRTAPVAGGWTVGGGNAVTSNASLPVRDGVSDVRSVSIIVGPGESGVLPLAELLAPQAESSQGQGKKSMNIELAYDVVEKHLQHWRSAWHSWVSHDSAFGGLDVKRFVRFQAVTALDPEVTRVPEARTVRLKWDQEIQKIRLAEASSGPEPDFGTTSTSGDGVLTSGSTADVSPTVSRSPTPTLSLREQMEAALRGTCELRQHEGRGWQWVAARDIKRGEVFLAETPVFSFGTTDGGTTAQTTKTVKTKSALIVRNAPALNAKAEKELPAPVQAAVRELHDASAAIGVSAEDMRTLGLAGHFFTNALTAGGANTERANLFLAVSRFNSDCNPNCFFKWRHASGEEAVVADRDVRAGEELTVAYGEYRACVTERRESLQKKFGFRCQCAACVTDAKTKKGGHPREKLGVMVELIRTVGLPGAALFQTTDVVKCFTDLMSLLDVGGAGPNLDLQLCLVEQASVAETMARICVISHGTPPELTRVFARIAADSYRVIHGEKSEEAAEMRKWAEDPPTEATKEVFTFC